MQSTIGEQRKRQKKVPQRVTASKKSRNGNADLLNIRTSPIKHCLQRTSVIHRSESGSF